MIIIKLISLILVAIGVCLIYDARILSKIWFGFGAQKEATMGLKILAFYFFNNRCNCII